MTNTSNKKIIIIAVVACLVCFYAGAKYGASNSSATSNSASLAGCAGQFGGARGGMRNGGGISAGQVLSKDATGLTLQLRSGGSMIVLYSSSTQVLKSTSGTMDDLTIGQQVMVSGTTNSDGSMTAQSIQIRPENASSTAQFGR